VQAMVPLNYNQLYYFHQIAEHGSISTASKVLLISSPALSMQLKELEESLGVALFDRVGKKLILTEAGAIVFEYAKDIFKLGFELRDTIGDRKNNRERNRIEIGCQDTIPKAVADELLTFLIQTKKCKVVLKESNREELIRLQNDYKLDLILTNSVPSVSNSFIYESKLLMKESLVILGHPKFKAAKGKISELAKIPFILPTYESSLRQKLESYFIDNKLLLDVVAEVEDKATEVDLALKGLGLIIVMKNTVPHLIEKKALIELHAIKDIQEEVWMIIGKRKILNPLALHVMKNFSFNT
jgi:LysR family transcriptional activator of nhaA